MDHQAIYYQKRAGEYDQIYQKPERQAGLQQLKKYLADQWPDKNILEIGCGTGYWTEVLARHCASVTALDINPEVIERAKLKSYPRQNVQFELHDFYRLEKRQPPLEGLFAGFVWSHVALEQLRDFLSICLEQVQPGAELIFIDNQYVEGSSTPISRTDEHGNSYQQRKLTSGETFEIIKNFPNESSIQQVIGGLSTNLEWMELEYFWVAKFRKPE